MFLKKVALAISKAISLTDIPPEYKDLKVINRGNTSIILEKDADTVIMLTRDAMKKDWLHFGIRISKGWEIHDVKSRSHKFNDFSVYAIEMPRLYPLSPARGRVVRKEVSFFKSALADLHLNYHSAKSELPKIIEYYDKNKKEDSLIYRLMEFLTDYHPEQWQWDLERRQFAQDSKGNIILVDPIVCADLIKVMKG